jgi:hypothetical protein
MHAHVRFFGLRAINTLLLALIFSLASHLAQAQSLGYEGPTGDHDGDSH